MIVGPLITFLIVLVGFIVYSVWMPIYHLRKFAYEGDKCKLALYIYISLALVVIIATIFALFFIGAAYA